MKSKVYKWIVGIIAFTIVVLAYLIQTGERGLSGQAKPLRSVAATRLDIAESKNLGWDSQRLDKVFDYAATLSSDTLVIAKPFLVP